MTNRELYLLVNSFAEKYPREKIPTLENYLNSLWAIASPLSFTEPNLKTLAEWLDSAFTFPTPDFNSEWLKTKLDFSKKGFEAWENRIILQIVDLREMEESGQLEDDMRYFGVDAPRGSRWYNFDTITYLECAVRGMYGGYEEDEVIVLQPPPAGESADSEIFEIKEFSWDDFEDLLEYGQFYE